MEGFSIALKRTAEDFSLKLTKENNAIPGSTKWNTTLNFGPLQINYSLPKEKVFADDQLIILIAGDVSSNPSNTDITPKTASTFYKREGIGALTKLEGHASVAVIDVKKQYIGVITDKFSSRPVFYGGKNYFLLGTSLQDLLSISKESVSPSQQGLYHYLYSHCIPSPNTVYDNFFKLEPSHSLNLESGKFKTKQQWKPEFSDQLKSSEDVLAESLRTILRDTISPYKNSKETGAFLSGGLDSSTVTAFLSEICSGNTPANTFTIGFSEPGYDESEFAKIVADKFKTCHFVRYVTPEDIHEALPTIAAYFEEPFGNSSALPAYFCAKTAKEKGINILLAGDGGDELYAGNERYAKQKLFHPWNRIPKALKPMTKSVIKALAKLPIDLFQKADSYAFQAGQTVPERLKHHNFLHQNRPTEVFTGDFLTGVNQAEPLQQYQARYDEISTNETDNMLYLDWKFTLADNDLVKVSKMCELAGVTVKYPMLSDALVAHCQKVPAEVKLPGQSLRHFYKFALAPILPNETINKSKHGFGLPFGHWLKTHKGLSDLVNLTLKQLNERNIFRSDFIEKAIELHQDQHSSYYGELIWLMVILELWLAAHHPDYKIQT